MMQFKVCLVIFTTIITAHGTQYPEIRYSERDIAQTYHIQHQPARYDDLEVRDLDLKSLIRRKSQREQGTSNQDQRRGHATQAVQAAEIQALQARVEQERQNAAAMDAQRRLLEADMRVTQAQTEVIQAQTRITEAQIHPVRAESQNPGTHASSPRALERTADGQSRSGAR